MSISNGVRLACNPMRMLGGNAIWNDLTTPQTKRWTNPDAFGKICASPAGYLNPYAWVLPRSPGRISAHRAAILTIGASGSGAEGISSAASSAITITVSGVGSQVVGGVGSTALTITANGKLFSFGKLAGTSSFAVTASAVKKAIGWLAANGAIAVSATMTAYATGSMTGTTDFAPVMTEGTIADAVWNKIITDLSTTGSAAVALKAAGSAGDPWSTVLPGSYAGTQAGALLDQIKALVGELHTIQGLDAGSPMEVTQTQRTAGDITLALSGDGITSTTVTRQ